MTAHEQLSGVTVIDLSAVGPASRATAALRDLGAAVVKVAAPSRAGRIDPPFFAYGAGRGMRRARIDLKAAEGREAFLALVRAADVVVESFRPGVADRLGIGYDACRAVNERIVYAAVSGYGREGPYAGWAGHDLDYLAVAGFLACQGRRADGGPAMPGVTLADGAGGGLHAALAIVAALYRRSAVPEAQFLDVSTADGVLHLMALFVDEYLATGEEPRPGSGLLTGGFACYDLYPARDGGWLAVAAIEPPFFASLCRALGCEEWIAHQMDPDPARQEAIRSAFRTAFAARDRDEWVAALAALDTCVAPVLSIAEVARDPHFAARGAFADVEHAERGRFRQVAPLLAGAARPGRPAAAPAAGATDTESLLSAAGLGPDDVADLLGRGIIE